MFMRKVLSWIGVAALAILVVVGGLIAYAAIQGNRLDNEARLYADKAVRPIIDHWNADALKQAASPRLLAAIKPEQLASMFQWFQTLGPLKMAQPCNGQVRIDVNSTTGRTLTGQYSCAAQFQNGAATIQLVLVKSEGEWRISGFHVSSPALIPHPQTGNL
jgi:hypothetical protein